jgi:hypothetical protein
LVWRCEFLLDKGTEYSCFLCAQPHEDRAYGPSRSAPIASDGECAISSARSPRRHPLDVSTVKPLL